MKKKHKRKYLINKKLQLGTALLVLAIQIPCILATGLGMSWFYLIYLDDRTTSSLYRGVAAEMGVTGLSLALGVLFVSIYLTRSVAGPIIKTGMVLRELAQDRLPEKKITFRKNDWFKELAMDLNVLADRMAKTRRARSRATSCLEELKDSLAADRGKDNGRHIQKIQEILTMI